MTEQCSGFTCPVEATISLIGGKYKAVILWHLMNNTLRYSELHRKIPKATDKMLAQQLRELEKDGLINHASPCMGKSFAEDYTYLQSSCPTCAESQTIFITEMV